MSAEHTAKVTRNQRKPIELSFALGDLTSSDPRVQGEAWGELFTKFSPLVDSITRRKVAGRPTSHEYQEASGNTWEAIAKGVLERRYESVDHLTRTIPSIAANKGVDRVRRKEWGMDEFVYSQGDDTRSAEEIFYSRESNHPDSHEDKIVARIDGERLSATIADRLPPAQRQALFDTVVVGLSHTESASARKTTPGASRVSLHRALTAARALSLEPVFLAPGQQVSEARTRERTKKSPDRIVVPTPAISRAEYDRRFAELPPHLKNLISQTDAGTSLRDLAADLEMSVAEVRKDLATARGILVAETHSEAERGTVVVDFQPKEGEHNGNGHTQDIFSKYSIDESPPNTHANDVTQNVSQPAIEVEE